MNNFYATKRSGKTLKIAINTALLFFALIVSGNSAFAQCPIGIPVVKNISSGSNVNMALSAFPSFPAVSYQWIATSNPNVTGESLSIVSSSIISDVLVNTSTSPQTVIYTVTPTAGTCTVGVPYQVDIIVAAPSAFPCDLSLYTNIGRTTVCENESFELYVAPKQSLTSPEVWKFTFTGVGLGSNYTSWAKSAVIPASTIGAGNSRTYTILLKKFPTYNDAQLNTNRICSNNVNITIDVIAAVSAPTVSPDVTACEGDPAPTFSVTNIILLLYMYGIPIP